MADFNFYLVMPVVVLAAYGLLALLLAPLFRESQALKGFVTLLGLVLAGAFTFRLWQDWTRMGPMETAHGMVRVDGFGLYVTFLVLIVATLTTLASLRFLEREGADHGEFYALLLLGASGMVAMVNTTHLMVILIGLEVFSLSFYVMAGMTRGRARSVEASLKYFLMGAFSSGFLIYGMALLYGTTGSLDLRAIGDAVFSSPSPLAWVGMGLVLVGFTFKIAAVPFHHWVPDVYEGAPTNVAGLMAAATKTVAFAALLRFLVGAFGAHPEVWQPVIIVLSVLTMTVANLVALAQTNIKRLLAFSSIVHAGYLMIAVVCRPEDGVSAILFYLSVYAFMTVGAFAVAAAMGRGDAETETGYDLSQWSGLGWRRPALALAMAVFLFSLAGIPPTGGFLGKYVIFQAAIRSGHYVLAVIGVLNAVVAAFYYLRVVVAMYMREPGPELSPLPVPPSLATALILAVAGVFYLGLAPGPVLDVVRGLAAALV